MRGCTAAFTQTRAFVASLFDVTDVFARRALIVVGLIALAPLPAFAQFVQQGSKLVGTGAVGGAQQGRAVALSGDGNTALVGGQSDGSLGAAWIYTRSGAKWTQQGTKLVPSDGTGFGFGVSTALSFDGNTAVIGEYGDSVNVGAAWIFVRSGTTWTQQGPKLVGSGADGKADQGQSVAISADGNTVIEGGSYDAAGVGAAWVFVRNGSTWTQQGSKLVGTAAQGASRQAFSVGLSADGNTALVGGFADNSSAGAAWVFTRSGGTWTQQGGKLTPSDASGSPQFGVAVALSGDGTTAAIGGPADNTQAGAVWVFTRAGSTWSQQGSKLVGRGASGSAHQGWGVSLSGNGNVLFEGGLVDNANIGAAWAFVRRATTWSQVGRKLVANDSVGTAEMGLVSSLSSDGRTAIVGGEDDNQFAGAAWIFAWPPHQVDDFDGDGLADAALLKSNGDWASLTSASGFTTPLTVNFTVPGSVPIRGDFDGDGKQDPAFYNPANGGWRFLKSGSAYAQITVNWGGPGFIPVPGDYDSDGKTDPAVYNTTTGAWSILQSSSNYTTTMTVNFGGIGYTPVPGQDFDGDAISDVAVYQASTGLWTVLFSSTNYTSGFSKSWGGRGYTLVPADYDGDGKADLGLYAPSNGGWYILQSSANFTTAISKNWGGGGYTPVPGDFDGDGACDLGLFQSSTGNWYVLLSSSNYASTKAISGWGSAGDLVLSSAIPIGGSDLLRAGDFDGDARSEITVYNAGSGVWSSLTSSSAYAGATNRSWGGGSYTPASGDYDGDGRADLGIYNQSSGNWYVLLSGSNFTTSLSKNAGGTGWVAAPADYDGDGKTDVMVYNTTSGQWFGLLSGSNYTTTISMSFGGTNYVPVPADFDGDGRADIGVYNLTTGAWSILLSSSNYSSSLSKSVGGTGYLPLPADYDGDGKADFVVYNTTSGLWYGLKSSTNYTTTLNVSWGGSGYTAVRGDYDGDGKADLATYVQSTGTWYILLSGANYTTTLSKNWGGSGYTAVPQ